MLLGGDMKENLKEIAKFSKKDAEVQISRGVPSEDGSRKKVSKKFLLTKFFCAFLYNRKKFLVPSSVGTSLLRRPFKSWSENFRRFQNMKTIWCLSEKLSKEFLIKNHWTGTLIAQKCKIWKSFTNFTSQVVKNLYFL